MTIQEHIRKYIDSQPESKSADIEVLHNCILNLFLKCKL